jgi:hypothetical protein
MRNSLAILFTCLLLSPGATQADSIERHVRYGDRYFLVSVLTEIFGESVRPIVERHILEYPEVFGGPCSLMEEVVVEDSETKKPVDVGSKFGCRQSLPESKTPAFSRSEITRNAFMLRACEDIVSRGDLVREALVGTYALKDEVAVVSALALRFYPLLERSEEFSFRVIEALGQSEEKDPAEAVPESEWLPQIMAGRRAGESLYEKALFNLCVSEDWQVP